MINRVWFKVEQWKDAAVWVQVSETLNSLDQAHEEAMYFDDKFPHMVPHRVVKVTEEVTNA